MKKQLLLFFSFLMSLQMLNATEVIIGSGTLSSTTYGPIYASSSTSTFKYSKHVYVFTEAELAAAGIMNGAIINKVGWDKVSTATNTSQFAVLMKSDFSTTEIPANTAWTTYQTGLTPVYVNTALSLPATTGWQQFALTNAFTYTGGSLIVMTQATWSANSAGLTWRYGAQATAKTGYWNDAVTNNNPTMTSSVNRPNIQLDFTPAPACAGKPSAGVIPAGLQTCGPIVTLRSNGISRNDGVTYQWQQSLNGTTWTNTVGGSGSTTVNYTTPSVTAATQYRIIATCTNGGLKDTSNATTIQPITKYASIPYINSFENTFATRCATAPFSNEVPDSFWINSPLSGNNSWRRNDAPVTISGWTGVSGAYTPAASVGTYSLRFHSYNAPANAQGSMDLYINMSVSGSKALIFDYINPSGVDSLAILLSEDGGETFRTVSAYGSAATWTRQSIDFVSTASRAVIRFLAISDFGNDDIGIDNLSITTPCTGKPSAGTVLAALSSCPGYTQALKTTGSSVGSGLVYQWQKSLNGTTWTNLAGGTALTASDIVTATSNYRLIATCAPSSQSDTSAAATITIITPTYATIPLLENFENWVTKCATDTFKFDAPSVNWVATPISGNNSWRRNDQGANGGWGSLTSYAYTPLSTVGSYSARFHSGATTARLKGTLDLYVNLSPAGEKELAFDYINTSGTDSLRVLLSTDGGVNFVQLDTTFKLSTLWLTKRIKTSATSATSVIRLEATADFGSTDIGLDNLSITQACAAKPAKGTISGPVSVCPNSRAVIGSTGTTFGLGIAYTWQRMRSGSTTWSTIAGATTLSLVDTLPLSTSYRLITTCTLSSLSDTSNTFTVTVDTPPYAGLPISESFENWITKCSTDTFRFDAPSINWVNNPTSGNNSWRRNDQGANGGWGSLTSYAYTPGSSSGATSARFHSGATSARVKGTLDLYVNLTGNYTKDLSFDYINTSGTDSFRVLLSTDGGLNFAQVDTTIKLGTVWARKFITLTANSATSVIRFEATADFGSTDIGFDSLTITPNCNITAQVVATGATSFCQGDSVRLTARGAGTFKWSTGSTDSTFFAKTSGKYYVSVTSGACSAVDSITVTVNPKPTVAFTGTAVGGLVTFANTTTNGASYVWYFGNTANDTSRAQNPTFRYTANGTYTVKLVVTSAAGCKDSLTKTVSVTRVGTNDLSSKVKYSVFPNPVDAMLNIQFDDMTSDMLTSTNRIIITNVLGQVMTDIPLTSKALSIQTTTWSTGIYFLSARIDGITYRLEQVVKQE